jgi:predicted RNA-binding Zn ribbon-like protein
MAADELRGAQTRWVWYGGRACLDLVNTRRNREADAVEYLERPADLADWLGVAGLITEPAPIDEAQIDEAQIDEAQIDEAQIDEALLADVRKLREAIDAGVRAAVTGRPFPVAALCELNAWLAAGPARPPQLRLSGGVAVLGSPASPRRPRQVISDIALDAAEVLGTELRDRLRICPGPGCGGRFADESPAGRRRWCSMAVCGNRNKAATHRVTVRK